MSEAIPARTSVPDLHDVSRLEDIVSREALAELCQSTYELFGLPLRIFTTSGALLADVHAEREVCAYVNGTSGGRIACAKTVAAVKALVPESNDHVLHPCFTGAVYRVVPLEHDGRPLARLVIGPYLPAELTEVPRSLLVIDPAIDAGTARRTLEEMPRVRVETAERVAEHVRKVLSLLVWSGHRAFLTSEMHVASVRESYRELAQTNSDLHRANERLKELDRLKSNFLATISHELRTPLTSVLGYSEMLLSGIAGPLAEEQREFVQTIHGKGDLLLKLIGSLLDLGKLEQGYLALVVEPVDVRALLTDLAVTVRPTAEKKDVQVVVEEPDGAPTDFRADMLRLRQIVTNLLDNAIKFSRAGTAVRLRATTTDQTPSDGSAGNALFALPRRGVEIRVADQGIGIAVDEHTKIFDAFYQVDGSSTREHGGTGLGLSIVKRLVDAHGGTITVESEAGVGTTFVVTLPEAD